MTARRTDTERLDAIEQALTRIAGRLDALDQDTLLLYEALRLHVQGTGRILRRLTDATVDEVVTGERIARLKGGGVAETPPARRLRVVR